MPIGDAAVARVLGHHAIVVRLRELHPGADQLLQARGDCRLHGPARNQGIACACLQQTGVPAPPGASSETGAPGYFSYRFHIRAGGTAAARSRSATALIANLSAGVASPRATT